MKDEVARYREELGVTTMLLRMNWPGTDFENLLPRIKRFEAVAAAFYLRRREGKP